MKNCFVLKRPVKTHTLDKHQLKRKAIKLLIKTSEWLVAIHEGEPSQLVKISLEK